MHGEKPSKVGEMRYRVAPKMGVESLKSRGRAWLGEMISSYATRTLARDLLRAVDGAYVLASERSTRYANRLVTRFAEKESRNWRSRILFAEPGMRESSLLVQCIETIHTGVCLWASIYGICVDVYPSVSVISDF